MGNQCGGGGGGGIQPIQLMSMSGSFLFTRITPTQKSLLFPRIMSTQESFLFLRITSMSGSFKFAWVYGPGFRFPRGAMSP